MSDHPRDCPHGRQWGKCDTCDLIEANKHIAALEADVTLYRDRLAAVATEREALEAENERLKSLACHEYWGCPIPGMTEANDALKAENERLWHDAEQWRKHEYGVARACEQGMADLARLAALDGEVGE